MDKLNYKQSDDVLIHVGDLVAKGNKNREVLAWMAQRQVLGVRGNHDQPVSHSSVDLTCNSRLVARPLRLHEASD
jgi:predicted phosphodiesterase